MLKLALNLSPKCLTPTLVSSTDCTICHRQFNLISFIKRLTLAKSSVSGFIPTFTEIQFSRPNQTVEYGHNNDIVSSVELSCTVAVEGSFSITWTGPNGTITDSGDKIKIYSADTTRTSILRITRLSLMDNGTYSCEASYTHSMNFDVGSATNTISLILGGMNCNT